MFEYSIRDFFECQNNLNNVEFRLFLLKSARFLSVKSFGCWVSHVGFGVLVFECSIRDFLRFKSGFVCFVGGGFCWVFWVVGNGHGEFAEWQCVVFDGFLLQIVVKTSRAGSLIFGGEFGLRFVFTVCCLSKTFSDAYRTLMWLFNVECVER